MPLKFIPTNVKYNDSGEFKNISIPADRAYMDEIITVSSTQPTNSDNKLWINTNEQATQTYQIPTMADLANYRTAAAQDAIDETQDAAIGIVITGKRPSMAVTAGQYVIVRNSTISGISDGLYTANAALSPSTDVTAANLTAVSGGGLNNLRNNLFITRNLTSDEITLATNEAGGFEISVPAISQYVPFSIGQIYITGEGSNGAAFNRGFQLQTNRVLLGVRNTTTASRTWTCMCTVIYKHI